MVVAGENSNSTSYKKSTASNAYSGHGRQAVWPGDNVNELLTVVLPQMRPTKIWPPSPMLLLLLLLVLL